MPHFIMMKDTGNLTLLENELENTPMFKEALRKVIIEVSKGRAELVYFAGQVKR